MVSLPLHWIDALFTRLNSFYGERFVNMWKTTDLEIVKQEWADGLGKFDTATLKAALEYFRDHIPKDRAAFPPTLPEFISICKSVRPTPEQQMYLAHKFEKSDRSDEFIATMKSMLKKSEVHHDH